MAIAQESEQSTGEDALFREEKLLNAGIALVVPAEKITAFFESKKLTTLLGVIPKVVKLSAEARTATGSIHKLR